MSEYQFVENTTLEREQAALEAQAGSSEQENVP
jgi:hypothetical protein